MSSMVGWPGGGLGFGRDEGGSVRSGWAAELGRLIRRRRTAGFRVRRAGGPRRTGGKLGCAVVRDRAGRSQSTPHNANDIATNTDEPGAFLSQPNA